MYGPGASGRVQEQDADSAGCARGKQQKGKQDSGKGSGSKISVAEKRKVRGRQIRKVRLHTTVSHLDKCRMLEFLYSGSEWLVRSSFFLLRSQKSRSKLRGTLYYCGFVCG